MKIISQVAIFLLANFCFQHHSPCLCLVTESWSEVISALLAFNGTACWESMGQSRKVLLLAFWHRVSISWKNFPSLVKICPVLSWIFGLLELNPEYYLHLCKSQDETPNFTNFIIFLKKSSDNEYYVAKDRGKLSLHYKKWRFVIFMYMLC